MNDSTIYVVGCVRTYPSPENYIFIDFYSYCDEDGYDDANGRYPLSSLWVELLTHQSTYGSSSL